MVETFLRHTDMTRQEALQKSLDLLNQVELSSPKEKLNYYPHQLSGGMRQRVMISMSLACSPRVLIADEPTTALDVTVQAQIFDLLTDLRKQTGAAIILITHDMGVVAELATRVCVMYGGRVVEQGTPAEILGAPREAYTRRLLAAVPKF